MFNICSLSRREDIDVEEGKLSKNTKVKKVLSIDGGGIKGVFPAAVLAALDTKIEKPINEYFDLIVGTSTGGIIALGLGLGIPPSEILRLYEEKGDEIFSQGSDFKGSLIAKTHRKMRSLFYGAQYSRKNLAKELEAVFGDHKLGQSQNRIVIPSYSSMTDRISLYKTAHHEKLETDYDVTAVEVALATSAAPVFFSPFISSEAVELLDGGVWANNPIAVAANEAVGYLKWPSDKIKILSLGTFTERRVPRNKSGAIQMGVSGYATHMFMAAQASAAENSARILTGAHSERQTIWRVNQEVPYKRYGLDKTKFIAEMKGRANEEARHNLADLKTHFFDVPADPFTPIYQPTTS